MKWFFVSVALVLLTVVGCGVNKSFRIDDGTTRSNGIMTVKTVAKPKVTGLAASNSRPLVGEKVTLTASATGPCPR
jgi:hypothetical protein